MIVIVNLERLSGDGYKMNANSPLVTPPSYIKYAQLRYTPFTSAQAIQGTFVTGAYSTVEFDVTGANLTRYLKLYTSTDGTTYNEVKSWGGTDGIRQKEYLTYSALLTQTTTNAPVPTVLENTLGGTIVWTRTGQGDYFAILAGAFTLNKTWLSPANIVLISGDNFSMLRTDSNIVTVITQSDNNLDNFPIEMRVYP